MKLKPLLSVVALLLGISTLNAAERPNILWLSTEDMSPNLGCYGDRDARTPHIDRLASEGVLYKNAFVPAPVCAVCRTAIITGVYAPSLGTHHMRSLVRIPAEIRCFPALLRDQGYYCTNNSKEDYNFRTPRDVWDESSGRAHWRHRPQADQPFFAVFNYTGTHESSARGDEPKFSRTVAGLSPEQRHDPATLTLPPYYPDTPKVRAHWARYYDTISALDVWIGERLAELKEAGLDDDTIVFFWSDHGAGLPRAKRWLYDAGLHVPLVVRIPEKFRSPQQGQPGAQLEQLVSLIDLPPTMLNLTGAQIPSYMQGRAFLGEDLPELREFVFASRDRMDESYDCSRAVRTARYKYIRNFMPWRPYAQHGAYSENNDVMRELRRLHAAGELTPEQSLFMQPQKPIEEFYDLQTDPHELNNLTRDGARPPEMEELAQRSRLAMRAMRDLGMVEESQLKSQQDGKPPYHMFARNLDAKPDFNRSYDTLLFRADTATLPNRVPGVEQFAEVARSRLNNGRFFSPDAYWETIGLGFTSTAETKAADIEALNAGVRDKRPPTQVAAAEMLVRLGELDVAASAMLDVYEHADSPWDQVAAANAIDLLPNFDQLGERLSRLNEQVSPKAADDDGRGSPGGYLARWSERFRQRVAKP